MKTFAQRYLMCFLIGLVLGHVFLVLGVWWVGLGCTALALVVNDAIGLFGFGASHWRTYRWSCILLYVLCVPVTYFGVLVASGRLGHLFIALGKLIS